MEFCNRPPISREYSSRIVERGEECGEKGGEGGGEEVAQIEFDKVDHRGRPLRHVIKPDTRGRVKISTT